MPTYLFHPDAIAGECPNYSAFVESQFCHPGGVIQCETQAFVLESAEHKVLEGVSWHCA